MEREAVYGGGGGLVTCCSGLKAGGFEGGCGLDVTGGVCCGFDMI